VCHWENRTGAPGHPNGTFEWATPSAPGTKYDNGAVTDGWCLLCHDQNSGSSASLGGIPPIKVVPSGSTWTGGWGHGSTANLGSDNSSGGPSLHCPACHYSTGALSSADTRNNGVPGFHASVNRKLVTNAAVGNREYPHPSDTAYTDDQKAQKMDAFCMACHTPGQVVRHTWDNAFGSRISTDTHPSDAYPVPDAIRFQKPAVLPLSLYLNYATTPPTSVTNTGNVVCVTCHDPHVRRNGVDNADAQMTREPWRTDSALCKRCHT
jgi:hypothetical protein